MEYQIHINDVKEEKQIPLHIHLAELIHHIETNDLKVIIIRTIRRSIIVKVDKYEILDGLPFDWISKICLYEPIWLKLVDA